MDEAKAQEITERINRLEQEVNAYQAELQLVEILAPLMESDGYTIDYRGE